jgi:hypothetical protein
LRVFRFKEMVEAHRFMESSEQIGKIVVRVPGAVKNRIGDAARTRFYLFVEKSAAAFRAGKKLMMFTWAARGALHPRL